MSVAYRWVQWNKHKLVYDVCLWGSILLFLGVFVGVGLAAATPPNQIRPEALLLRGLAFVAFFLLTVILCLGPLHRLLPATAPLLYNRRHLGVSMFAVSAAHGLLALLYYHGFGIENPAVSLLSTPPTATGLFPFEYFGIAALLILFLMAATSHDFWLKNLGHRAWKRLHLFVYLAYALLVAHVALGYLQRDVGPLPALLLWLSLGSVLGLQTASRLVNRPTQPAEAPPHAAAEAWVKLCPIDDVQPNAAKTVTLATGTRVAVVRHTHEDGHEVVSCVSNTCQHQGGPLGEGRVIDGCLTCPWHGYQYLPAEGQSPPPFTETLPTYRVRVVDGVVEADPDALPAGTRVEPAPVEQTPVEPATAASSHGGSTS